MANLSSASYLFWLERNFCELKSIQNSNKTIPNQPKMLTTNLETTNNDFQHLEKSNYENNSGHFLFYFEKKFYDEEFVSIEQNWLQENWNISFYYAFIYLLLVYMATKILDHRGKFHFHHSLVAWNVVLAVFSTLGTVRFLPNFLHFVFEAGINGSVCQRIPPDGVTRCWLYIFILSKMIELIDTVFVVMRKQKLIFLHWYHHSTVLVYSWYSFKDLSSTGPWFIGMNYFVHSLMYSYYALRSLRVVCIPKWINMIITSLQISQMAVGLCVNYLALRMKLNGEKCLVSYENIFWSFFMYFTYFVLFFHFFRNAYLKKNLNQKKL